MRALEMQGVSFSYDAGAEAVRDVSLAVEMGERVAIIGQNGAGKTTLTRMTNGLLRPKRGRVLVCGEDVAGRPIHELARLVGYCFQNPDDQIFHANVYDEVAFGPLTLGFDAARVRRSTEWALELCGLADVAGAQPYDLPYSARKLVSLASTISCEPRLLVLDEPTAGQDVVGIEAIERVMTALPDTAVIVVTHDMEFVARNFDRVVTMVGGQCALDAGVLETFSNHALLEEAHVEQPFLVYAAERLGIDLSGLRYDDLAGCIRFALRDAAQDAGTGSQAN